MRSGVVGSVFSLELDGGDGVEVSPGVRKRDHCWSAPLSSRLPPASNAFFRLRSVAHHSSLLLRYVHDRGSPRFPIRRASKSSLPYPSFILESRRIYHCWTRATHVLCSTPTLQDCSGRLLIDGPAQPGPARPVLPVQRLAFESSFLHPESGLFSGRRDRSGSTTNPDWRRAPCRKLWPAPNAAVRTPFLISMESWTRTFFHKFYLLFLKAVFGTGIRG